jgi:hypothetical protein
VEPFPLKIINYYVYGFLLGFTWFNMTTSDDFLVTDETVVDNIFPDPPPAAPDPRARRLAMRVHMGASTILGVDTDDHSPPATHLSSQTLLSPPTLHGYGEGFLSVTATRGRSTTPLALAMQHHTSEAMGQMNSFGALSEVSLENSTDPPGDPSPNQLKPPSSLQALVDDTYGAFYGADEYTPVRLKGIFDQEVRVIDNTHHVPTTPAPAMRFEQLMEVAMRTMTTVALISDLMGTLKEATTKNATSIDHLIELTWVNKEAIVTLGNRLEDINRSVGTSIICLKHAIGANATAINHLENSSGLPPLSTTVGEIDTKVDTVRHDFDRHVGEVRQELDTFAELKPIMDNVRYSQLGAICDHIKRVE